MPIIFPAAKYHYPLVGTKLYCLVTEALHMCVNNFNVVVTTTIRLWIVVES